MSKKQSQKKKGPKIEVKNESKIKISSTFIYPQKKPVTYKVSKKREKKSSKVLNKKDFEKAKETINFIKQKNGIVL